MKTIAFMRRKARFIKRRTYYVTLNKEEKKQ
jgi:hypothetical protein